MYNFHASAAAYAEYWNNTFGTETVSVSRAQIWQAFIQESIRVIAEESKIDVELNDGLSIKEVTVEAFSVLGENGIIRAADKHACLECTQIYRKTSEPVIAADTAANPSTTEKKYVKMVVLDGIVMGPMVNQIYQFFILYSDLNFSIVHLIIVRMNFQTLVVDHSVIYIIWNMAPTA